MEGNLRSFKENLQEFQEKCTQTVSAFDQILNMKSDSFTLEMAPFSHLTNKDLSHTSRNNLQRSLSRKGSQTGAEKKMDLNCLMNDVERDVISSPKASLMVGIMPEKLIVVNQTTDHISKPQVQHQIAIMTGGSTTRTKPAEPTQISLSVMRSSSFKQSSLFKPRRILFFFATLSSLGTILLICLTLSMAKYNGDDNSHARNLTWHQ
ncbi:hypothetical protein L6452_19644 [Arctium lappa]|uniref:Uncharacterized protein n=1 Tax=Arctium lappa TaxID=4217 RepID=A0ACB9B955_ARCLA|nr:hypothetical protein L6452_19644 [Arctium lappa]